jgi:hypothetical protein
MDAWRKLRAELFSKLADVADEFDEEWDKGMLDGTSARFTSN